MRTISLWAKVHPWSTRIIIIFLIYPLMNIIGWILGDLLWETGIQINPFWYYILLVPGLLLFAFYPYKRNANRRYSYTYRKSFDFSLAILTMAFVMVWGNNLNRTQPSINIFPVSYANTITNAYSSTIDNNSGENEKNPIKKLIKAVKKKYKNASKEEKVGLIILAIAVAILLAIGIGALACNIACAGSEIGGFIILLLGVGLIVFALVKVLRRIKQGPKSKEPETTSS